MFLDLTSTSFSFSPLLPFYVFYNRLHLLYTCRGDEPLSFVCLFIYKLNKVAIFSSQKGRTEFPKKRFKATVRLSMDMKYDCESGYI